MNQIWQYLKNKWIKYLFETVAIFVGIFGAFTLDSWNQHRLDRKEEILILKEISEDLSAGMQSISQNHQFALNSKNATKIIIQHLAHDLPYHDSLSRYFSNIHNLSSPEFPSSGFEALKSRGFGLVTNAELRRNIISMFQQKLTGLKEGLTYDSHERHDFYLRTVYTKYFTLLSSDLGDPVGENRNELIGTNSVIVPVDYDALIKDQQYENLVREMYNNLNWMLTYMNWAAEQMKNLKDEIDMEIRHLQ